jgi:hypothetical protein
MRNGLTKTLAAVAFACLGFQAFAVAPVIREIPSPVVTDDANPVSGSFLFVYADWIDLRAYTTDDGNVSNLTWVYEATGTRYSLNNAVEIGASSKVTPPANAIINSAANIAAGPESDPDGSPFTVTVRDVIQSPIGGPNVPGGINPGDIVGQETITLYASDGTTVSNARSFKAYTQAYGGNASFVDRLSFTPGPTPETGATPGHGLPTVDFNATGTNNWTSVVVNGATASTAGGLCIFVPAANVNIGVWVSPYAIQALDNNAVWRLRTTMSTTQNTAGLVPMWDILVENLGGPASEQAYIGDSLYLDLAGSANAVQGPAQGRNNFETWYTVAAVDTPQWNNGTTGAIRTALDADNDYHIIFRILDTDASTGIGGQFDTGTICLADLAIDKFDTANIASSLNVYNLNPIVSGASGVTVFDILGTLNPGPGNGAVEDFLSNPLTITPADATNGWVVELVAVIPGDTQGDLPISDPGFNAATSADDWPIAWESDTLYELQVELSAPDATGETNGADALLLGFETKSTELLQDSYVLSGFPNRPAMPKQISTVGSTQIYKSFWNSHTRTLVGVPGADRFRWKLLILSTDTYNRPLFTDVNNHGGIRIHSVKVNKVTFHGQ